MLRNFLLKLVCIIIGYLISDVIFFNSVLLKFGVKESVVVVDFNCFLILFFCVWKLVIIYWVFNVFV